MQQLHFTLEQWRDQFKPVQNHIQKHDFFNGVFFETCGADAAHVAAVAETDPLRVWTVEDVGGCTVIINGLRRANHEGYLITERPAPANTYIEVDCEGELSCADDLRKAAADDMLAALCSLRDAILDGDPQAIADALHRDALPAIAKASGT